MRQTSATAGTQTAALCAGGDGSVLAVSEEYDGSTWTEGPDLNTARKGLIGSGTQTAALAFGGYSTTYSADAETNEPLSFV